MSTVSLDPARQQQAKEYARRRVGLIPIEMAAGFGYLSLWLFTGWSVILVRGLEKITDQGWLVVLLFAGVLGLGYSLIGLPLQFYRGFILPHTYGLSTQSLPRWVVEQVKSLPIGAVLGGIVLEVGYWILQSQPSNWWIWVAVFLLIYNVLLTNLAPVVLMPMFNRYSLLGESQSGLSERLLRLAEKAGSRAAGVYKYDMSRRSRSASAALTGLWKTRRIILSDTLLEQFQDDEIEAVVAHELGHHVHRDIPIGILLESGLTLGGLYLVSIGLNAGLDVFGFTGPADVAALPLIIALFGIYEFISMPLYNAYSRWRETRADLFSVQLTGNGQALASALTRLANQNLADTRPEPWVEFFLYSHPALGRRISRALEAESQTG